MERGGREFDSSCIDGTKDQRNEGGGPLIVTRSRKGEGKEGDYSFCVRGGKKKGGGQVKKGIRSVPIVAALSGRGDA